MTNIQKSPPPPIILASGSPRRRELLALIIPEFERLSLDLDETVLPDELPGAYTLRVSHAKAQAARNHIPAGAIIIAADTTVADDTQILGKPADDDEAHAMLAQLRGRAHQVYTAITLIDTQRDQVVQDLAITDVVMRPYGDDEMAAYIASRDPFDKAGGYAIQNQEFAPVANINGCYANVVGLPLCHLMRALQRLGVNLNTDTPGACQDFNAIDCPVYTAVLENQSSDGRVPDVE
ncbi:MAG: septum formation protein Maf [Chloroflexi bacterium]|nr:septum formation protein Maf [Chloroflexota bacterium]